MEWHKSQSLDWELDTVNSSPISTDWKFPIQTNVHVAQVLKPPTTSCSPAPPSMLWDARHGPVRWRPTGSFGDQLRHCGRLQTLPYSPDWRSNMARNAEEEDSVHSYVGSRQLDSWASERNWLLHNYACTLKQRDNSFISQILAKESQGRSSKSFQMLHVYPSSSAFPGYISGVHHFGWDFSSNVTVF